MEQILLFWGLPSAITGLLFWWFKKKLDDQDAKQTERENNQRQLILMMMQSTRANNVGIEAIARAVQRIPDAHCNGDMEKALKKMSEYQNAEKNFLMEQGINHIFE